MHCHACNEPCSHSDYQAGRVFSCPDVCEERTAICLWCAPDFIGFRCRRDGHPMRNIDGISLEDLAGAGTLDAARSSDAGNSNEEGDRGTAETYASMWICIICDGSESRFQTMSCPGFADDNCLRMILCMTCYAEFAGQDIRCSFCSARLVDGEGLEAAHLPEGGRTLIGLADPPPGCEQAGMQCYAAATATACNWVRGTALTADDVMHLYLMSAQAEGDAAVLYPPAFSAAQTRLWPDASVTDVQAEMRRDAEGESALLAAVRGLGVPVFPDDVPHLYVPVMTQEHFKNAMADQCVIMIASSNHWEVVYACEVDSAGVVCAIRSFCPISGFSSEVWDGGYEGYLVGRNLP